MLIYTIQVVDENNKKSFFKNTYREWDFINFTDKVTYKIHSVDELEDAFITSDKTLVECRAKYLEKEYNVKTIICEYEVNLINEIRLK